MITKKEKVSIALVLSLFVSVQMFFAQDTTTVIANSDEISEHLDLEAVASIFGDSKDLQDFEDRLNDPKKPVSNLDLNEDNNVDFLRVVELVEEDTHLIAIQAVMGKDTYQDVATLEVEKDAKGVAQVQVVGDVYLYGPNYIVEPVYFHRPLIFSIFWRPYYRPFRSVYYWGHYPRHFHFWRPFHVHKYRNNVHRHRNVKHRYARVHHRRSVRAVRIHNKVRRNDFGKRYPERSYAYRKGSVNTVNGTKTRTAGVKKANGTKIRTATVKKADGTKKRAISVKKPNGTRKTVVGVNKPNGNKYRAASVKKGKGNKRGSVKKTRAKKKTGQKKKSTRKKKR